jgi:hypothetical protein
MRGITLGEWFREYNTTTPEFTPEDIAWTLIQNNTPWPATPELVAYMTQLVKELDLPVCREKDNGSD